MWEEFVNTCRRKKEILMFIVSRRGHMLKSFEIYECPWVNTTLVSTLGGGGLRVRFSYISKGVVWPKISQGLGTI